MMKKFTQLFVCGLLTTGLVFTSCKKDEPDNNPGANTNTNTNTNNNNTNTHITKMNATVVFNGTSTAFDLQEMVAKIDANGDLSISATDKDQVTNIGMLFKVDTEKTITASEAFITLTKYVQPQTEAYAAVSGNLTITKVDKTNKIVEGTFTAELEEPVSLKTASITGGTFSIKYTE